MILLAIILLLALATGETVLYRLTYFLALATAGSYSWARVTLRGLDIWAENRAVTRQAGESIEGSIHLRNKSSLPIDWVEVVQMTDMPGEACSGATRLPAQGSETWNVRRFCHVRGVYSIGPLVARSLDPLGLFRVQTTQGEPVTVVVYPNTVELPYFSLPAADLSPEEGVRHRMRTESAHAGTVREYNHGDSLSRVHWPSSAKHDQLMSKEFECGGSGDVWVILDLEQAVRTGEGTERTDEYAVAIAASLVRLAMTEERAVGLIASGDREYLLPLDGGPKHMSRVLEMLAWCRAEGDVPLAKLLLQSAARFGVSTSLIVVTSSVATEWADTLPDLMHRGLNIAVVLVDPASFGGDQSCYEILARLVRTAVRAYMVGRGDSIPLALSRPLNTRDLRSFEQSNEPESALVA